MALSRKERDAIRHLEILANNSPTLKGRPTVADMEAMDTVKNLIARLDAEFLRQRSPAKGRPVIAEVGPLSDAIRNFRSKPHGKKQSTARSHR